GDKPSGLSNKSSKKSARRDRQRAAHPADEPEPGVTDAPKSLAMIVLGLSGFAALVHEIAWTRILTLVLGPTTYAFAATVAAVIVGIAIGSGAGAWLVGRTTRPAAWLSFSLSLAALTTSWTYSFAGQRVPSLVARQLATSSTLFEDVLRHGALLTPSPIRPTP